MCCAKGNAHTGVFKVTVKFIRVFAVLGMLTGECSYVLHRRLAGFWWVHRCREYILKVRSALLGKKSNEFFFFEKAKHINPNVLYVLYQSYGLIF